MRSGKMPFQTAILAASFKDFSEEEPKVKGTSLYDIHITQKRKNGEAFFEGLGSIPQNIFALLSSLEQKGIVTSGGGGGGKFDSLGGGGGETRGKVKRGLAYLIVNHT